MYRCNSACSDKVVSFVASFLCKQIITYSFEGDLSFFNRKAFSMCILRIIKSYIAWFFNVTIVLELTFWHQFRHLYFLYRVINKSKLTIGMHSRD